MIVAKVTPEQYETLREQLAAEGYLITGNSGVIVAEGTRTQVTFDGVGTLKAEVTHTPFLVPKSLAEGRIAAGLRAKGVECSQQG